MAVEYGWFSGGWLRRSSRVILVSKLVPGMRLHSVATAYALWILGVFVAYYAAAGQDDLNVMQFALICGAVPVVYQVLLLGVDWRGLVAPVKMWLAFLLVILLSYVVNGMNPQTAPGAIGGSVIPPAWVPMVFTLNTIYIMAIVTVVAACPDRRLLRATAGLYGIFTAPFLVYIILTGERTWGRLTAGTQPIMWGLLGLTVCLAAFARKPGVLAAVAFAVGMWSILESSSRESLVALAIALAVVAPLYLQGMKQSRLLSALVGLSVMLFAATVLFDPYILNVVHYVGHDVLLVDSPNRGVNSGFTGRTEIWADTFNLWLKSPVFGIGFRQHERFLEGVPAHNSYLAMLADTGLIGLIVYLMLLVWSLVAAWGIRDQGTRRFIVATIVAYIVNGFFDRRTINAGNPFGIFFLLCCSVALVDQSLRKTAEVFRRSLKLTPEQVP